MPTPAVPDPTADGGSAGAAEGAGWHPDPTGRHTHRWWDGATWTTHVSGEGTVGEDALEPSGDMLDATSLAFDMSASGVRREGTWITWDRATDAPVGSIEVSWGTGFVVHTSYVVRDAAGRVLLTLEAAPQVGWPGLHGRDHLGRPCGRAEARGEALSLLAPRSTDPGAPEVTWATGQASGLRFTNQGRALEGPLATDLVAHDGSPAGSVHVAEPAPPHPYRDGTGPTWAYLERPADLHPTLRLLGVVAVPMLALMATQRRDGQSRRHRQRD